MLGRSQAALCAAGLFAALATGCSERPADATRADGIEPGAAAQALAGVYCITDVQADPVTYHFDGPRWVIDAAEGLGPRVLGLTVAGLAEPVVSTTVAHHPQASDLSTAVGYSLGEFYFVQASAAYTVDATAFRRLEAYVDYARSTWVVREAGCGAVLGTGVSFKPIGVYFKVREIADKALDGSTVIGVLPGCVAGQCGVAPDPPPPGDRGAGDGGGA